MGLFPDVAHVWHGYAELVSATPPGQPVSISDMESWMRLRGLEGSERGEALDLFLLMDNTRREWAQKNRGKPRADARSSD